MHRLKSLLPMAALFFPACMSDTMICAQSRYDAQFASYPVYRGDDLELSFKSDSTVFKLWSPAASQVRVNIYDRPVGGSPVLMLPMAPDPVQGTWTALAPGCLYGKYYTFQIMQDDAWLPETPGVWAKAVAANGHRAAVVNLRDTDPDGWQSDRGPFLRNVTDAVIYEMHHRDFSASPSAGNPYPGKFLALTRGGTASPQGEATGIDHLKELGVTHVHILPSYDFNSVDELHPGSKNYNWGYDPLNYNVPEGSYSTDPLNPESRIREMKQMVKALHDAGIGVVMDVVYNHTADTDMSNFELCAPGYYHRHWDDGRYSDASGCGNETASDRGQMRDFIVRSVLYWADEYHIDGFRFDLMAIHDTDTMNEVAARLRQLRPDILVYGEGWTAGDSPLAPERRALKQNVSAMQGVAVFSDDLRDAVKGHYSDASDRGFASGKPGLEETVKIGIAAATPHPQIDYSKGNNSKFPYAASPEMIVNYVSCHDDLTLTDKLRKSMPDASDEVRKRVAKLAQTIVFTSQGIPFIFAGEEIFRDKKGVHNSYRSPDSINAIDWSLKAENRQLFDYYRELVALRKAHPAFRMTSADQIARHLHFDDIDAGNTPNLISYSLTDHANGDQWEEIKVVLNGSDQPRTVDIPRASWLTIASDGRISAKGNLPASSGGRMTVAPYSALILAR